MSSARKLDAVPLWPEGAPRAKGDGPEDRPHLVPFLLPGPSKHAAIVVCPGGGYTGRAAHEAEPVAQWLNTLGLSAFVLHYRVAPYRHPQPLTDAQRAMRMVRARADEWHIDVKRVGILGFSAGGHLAITTATIYDTGRAEARDAIARQSSRPDALIACYPVVSFHQFGVTSTMENLLGPSPDIGLELYLSLEHRITRDTPSSFVWHTADDESVPVEHSLLYASECHRHRVPCELHVFPSGPHGLGLATDHPRVSAWTDLCAQWLKDAGFRE